MKTAAELKKEVQEFAYSSIIGKKVGETLRDYSGNVIAWKGAVIDLDTILRVKQWNQFQYLVYDMK